MGFNTILGDGGYDNTVGGRSIFKRLSSARSGGFVVLNHCDDLATRLLFWIDSYAMLNIQKLPTKKNFCPSSLHENVLRFAICSKPTRSHHFIHPCIRASRCPNVGVTQSLTNGTGSIAGANSPGLHFIVPTLAWPGLGWPRPDADRAEASSELTSSHGHYHPVFLQPHRASTQGQHVSLMQLFIFLRHPVASSC